MEQSLAVALGLTPLPRDPVRDAEIGAAVRRHRTAAGLGVEALAAQARLTGEELTCVEAGDARLPVRVAPHLARALGVSIGDLLAR